eukprot:CAMPEP_0174875506 /NCGR_PEP_ID=MMETSP1114-20130205/78463_1 /TAXON_ID=312471 /ORGANISM="Neobodo designis, Strain CCAP 1951/1" /LENGTH=342 /DNA_ID=CAMNT_0016110853 /DNA_START=1 /DNA_END=1029 /DNA_ORIENTATION=+
MAASASTKAPADGWGVTWEQLDKRRYYGMTLCTSICTRLVIYPVNMAKTRVQHEGSGSADGKPKRSEGTLRLLHRVAKEEGVARLYRGFMFNTVLGLVGGPYFLTVIERSRAFYRDDCGFSPTVASSAAGLTATFSAQLLFVPSDNVTQRLMVKSAQGTGAEKEPAPTSGFQQARLLYRTSGLLGFYRGIGVSLMVYAPTSMLFWPTYTTLRGYVTPTLEANGAGDAAKWFAAPSCAALAGSFAMSCTTPLDAVKTRMQLTTGQTTLDAARALMRAEGLAGFTLGLRMRASSGAFMYPVFLTSYEFVKWYATVHPESAEGACRHECEDEASACAVCGGAPPE